MTTSTEDRTAFAESIRAFARDRLAAGALERAHAPGYPWEVAELLAQQGLLGLTVPEEDGGQGATLLDAVLAIQEIGLVCPKSADVVQAGNFGALRTFAEYATDDQKARFLPGFLAGKSLLGLAMSEPEAGSAVTDLTTSAERDGDSYVVDGTKIWSTHSVEANVFLVYVRFGPGVGGIGSVLVERGTPGLEIGKPSEYMSGEQWAPLYFDGCRIPAENVLLGPGGFKKQISGFNVERLGNAARSLTLGRLAFTIARDHVLQREQFGRTLADFQGIQWKFADMAVALDGAQLLLDRAAANAAQGLPSAYETSVAKLAANQAGFQAADQALQVMGAMGYSTETLVEYCFRRTRGWMIAGGSLEVLRNRIAEDVLGRRFSQRAPK
ncbi:acyl-CoA dehydrogenase [Amycolatopsis mediterranei S699]|uniref:Acyl-CoA dehydrogenase n=3 Tax=Amycolatopsis mediterranei TaxID=33910 RepID=A0A0H3D4L4_AMYMU|nr:acyl-CoA dehydrogenase [Amycolatopsis mediterranei]ADJ45621.1 acyl-CoA dehydrogenase [Amycolatopsis mediterranei U32]AEK42400.1 acyl-CoA dehydrogenase [Amycolatopsis mediterranei S699]AFO77333.1 acyl-CoA dehydrogenase [Amycolatopsis mediterranei S699]AGT84461.1 acyl-CoA dehydrogenase [Amycolatopsis mediterranei RB]KDO05877.1 acyl-CoA dehydrogenase [Amycolatopsis mediterranei]